MKYILYIFSIYFFATSSLFAQSDPPKLRKLNKQTDRKYPNLLLMR